MLLLLLTIAYLADAQDCGWNKYQCGEDCQWESEPCQGVCPEGRWLCRSGDQCISTSSLCNGYPKTCKDGSHLKNCPQCKDSVGVVPCNGSLICEDSVCNGTCLTLNRRVCGDHCITAQETCAGQCIEEGTHPDRAQYPVFCEEEGRCIHRSKACGGVCKDPAYPIWAPFRGYCTTESDCLSQGPIVDQAEYMCNAVCIPAYIPCNNTCLDSVLVRTNRRVELFGPLVCEELEWSWRRRPLKTDKILKVKAIIGTGETMCLPGSFRCNGTCSIDIRQPYHNSDGRRGENCVEACHRVRQWPCNGTCIDSYDSCNGVCKDTHWLCNSGKCISKKYSVCDGEKDCDGGEDEENCPECPEGEVIMIAGKAECKCNTKDLSEPEIEECCEDKMVCKDRRGCVALYKINDGTNDCKDGSDEGVIVFGKSGDKILNETKLIPTNIFKFSNLDRFGHVIWTCDGNLLNTSEPCQGQCKNGWKTCPGQLEKCIHEDSWCPADGGGSLMRWCNSTDDPEKERCEYWNTRYEEQTCEKYDWNTSVVSSTGDKCKYYQRWICNDKVVCAEQSCPSNKGPTCPPRFYLCGNICKPDFVSCNGTCAKNGFFCERQQNITIPNGEFNLTGNSLKALTYKRYTARKQIFWADDHDSDDEKKEKVLISLICGKLYKDGGEEEDRCCLPLDARCDGVVECWNDDMTDEDGYRDCRVGLGMCGGQLTCLADKCGQSCMPGLKDCGYGGGRVQCAASYGGFAKTESSSAASCMDWTRRQAGLPDVFASCSEYGCFPPQLLSTCTGYPRPKESLAGPCDPE